MWLEPPPQEARGLVTEAISVVLAKAAASALIALEASFLSALHAKPYIPRL